MFQRNWLDLSRKLVDRFDLEDSINGISQFINDEALAFWGEGVLISSIYPNPFPITLSGVSLGGTVGNGIAFDPNGQIVRIDPSSPTSKTFTNPASDPLLPRWDLLVIRYAQTGDTPIPKPSDPITTVFLNLHDDFLLAVIPGTPSATPAYPSKGANDIILAGLRVPAAATLGTQMTVDYSVREMALGGLVHLPDFVQEQPAGVVNGTNQNFTLSQVPLNSDSILVTVDGLALKASEWSVVGQVVTITTAPALGQTVEVLYIANSPASINPLSGFQEVPSGAVNGINSTFNLSGQAANQNSTMVFVDGALADTTEWSLIQNPSNSSIKFNALSIPQPGQSVYVFYFVNAASVGLGGGGGNITGAVNEGSGVGVFDSVSGTNLLLKSIKAGTNTTVVDDGLGDIVISATTGGSSGYVNQGDESIPNTVAPASGITPTSDKLQSWYIKGPTSGGRQNVTANPQIAAGTSVGERISLTNVDGTDQVVFNDGNGLSLSGTWPPVLNSLYANIELEWTGLRWNEVNRK